jgi:hypothetical protein
MHYSYVMLFPICRTVSQICTVPFSEAAWASHLFQERIVKIREIFRPIGRNKIEQTKTFGEL